MANEKEYSSIITVYVWLCACSDYCNIKRSAVKNLAPFVMLFSKTALILVPPCNLSAELLCLLQSVHIAVTIETKIHQ